MDSPVDYFENVIRVREESALPIPSVDVDHLLSLSSDDRRSFTKALADYYGQSHWSSEASTFGSATEAAFQMVAAGICGLRDHDTYRPTSLDCCVRVIHSPALAAYVIHKPHNYIAVPVGFIASVQSYVSTIYALASIGATAIDPSLNSNALNSKIIPGALVAVWEKDQWAFLEGVFEYSSQLLTAPIVDSFDDYLAFTAFDRDFHVQMNAMMRPQRLQKLGFTSTEETLSKFQEVGRLSSLISKLLLIYTICHEFGHLLVSTVPDSDTGALASDESLADLFGTQILWRLYEARLLQKIYPGEINPSNIVSGVMAFHSWNLSKSLAELLAKVISSAELEFQPLLDNVHEIAKRWCKVRTILQKALSTDEDASSFESAVMLTDSWNIPCAGLLLMNARARGQSLDLYEAGEVLPLLANRQSKLFELLSKPRMDKNTSA